MTKDELAKEIAERWPDAVMIARIYREVFGPEVRLMHARNDDGEELGKRAS